MVSDVLEDQQRNSPPAQKERLGQKQCQKESHQRKTKVTGNEEIANSGHRKARAQEAQNERLSCEMRSWERANFANKIQVGLKFQKV